MGGLVGSHLATLRELQTYYSYEDALNMAEVVRVDNHNQRMEMEN